jgi:hypothetical protein
MQRPQQSCGTCKVPEKIRAAVLIHKLWDAQRFRIFKDAFHIKAAVAKAGMSLVSREASITGLQILIMQRAEIRREPFQIFHRLLSAVESPSDIHLDAHGAFTALKRKLKNTLPPDFQPDFREAIVQQQPGPDFPQAGSKRKAPVGESGIFPHKVALREIQYDLPHAAGDDKPSKLLKMSERIAEDVAGRKLQAVFAHEPAETLRLRGKPHGVYSVLFKLLARGPEGDAGLRLCVAGFRKSAEESLRVLSEILHTSVKLHAEFHGISSSVSPFFLMEKNKMPT